MKIEAVDFFYLSMPQVRDIADGSQDMLLVRLRSDGYTGWGECEASPLVTIASLVCPMSHSACKPVRDSVLGQTLAGVPDISRIGALVRAQSLDLLQADHTLSGIDMAMWDLLGKKQGEPVYRLLGYEQAYPKTPYASALFGDTAAETREKARNLRRQGFRAAKFGWGSFGRGNLGEDEAHVRASREGLGDDAVLVIDAGTIWGEDVDAAALRLPILEECAVTWLEEPFVSGALDSYRRLAERARTVRLAAGEGAHNYYMARHMIDHARLGYIQIDAGRIGGIRTAKWVADHASAADVQYVNHSFTSHLALSASLQPYAGLGSHTLCEYPVEAKPLARDLTRNHLIPDREAQILLPDRPGLGLTVHPDDVDDYLVDVEIRVAGRTIYRTPEFAE